MGKSKENEALIFYLTNYFCQINNKDDDRIRKRLERVKECRRCACKMDVVRADGM
jgi:hypothetical protein